METITKLSEPILGTPAFGWSHITLGSFQMPVSYLTDVPVDILKMLKNYQENGIGYATFDTEGHNFIFILVENYAYIIVDDEDVKSFNINNVDVIKNIVDCINNHTNAWYDFITTPHEDKPSYKIDFEKHQKQINQLLQSVKSKLPENMNYDDCPFYSYEEESQSNVFDHPSYTSYCSKSGEKKELVIPETQCKRCMIHGRNHE